MSKRLIAGLILSSLGLVACGDDDAPPPPPDGGSSTCMTAADCDDGLFCNGAEACNGGICEPASVPACLAGQTCDDAMDVCRTDCAVEMDADGDGVDSVDCMGTDCDDSDGDTFPGNPELCDVDGHDEDCNTATFGDRDLDGDGDVDAICCNGDVCGTDCNDLQAGIHDDSPEVCNGYDDDCDELTDEGTLVDSWPDTDFDLHGDRDAPMEMRCAGAHGYATVGDDCDDATPYVHPAQVEICDTVDNDCDEMTDEAPAATTWYVDGDDDGFGSPDPTTSRVSCLPLTGYSLRPTDCDDGDATVSPAAAERCDGLDDNCNGLADYLIGPGNFEDDDSDSAADPMCPSGDDCDDFDPTTRPGATEICDRRDNDCNDMIDDGTAMGIWYRDTDGDTWGEDGTTMMSCDPIVGYITRGGDCDDTDSAVHPVQLDGCNGVDDDCDGDTDEGSVRSAFYCDADSDDYGAGTPELGCSAPPTTASCPAWAGDPSDCAPTDPAIGAPGAWYPDTDMDDYGDRDGTPVVDCSAPIGYDDDALDCDDDDALVSPDGVESCNLVDDDCNGMVDDDPVADDPMNCGMCGRACAAGETCSAGECLGLVGLVSGISHACALYTTGDVWCWGSNTDGETGQGTFASPRTAGRVVTVTGLPLDDATVIASNAAAGHTCAVRSGGTVVCWGRNDNLQCGADASPTRSSRAVEVPGITNAVDVGVGESHSCAVLMTGGVRCWGANGVGQLGSGAVSATPTGTPVVMVENDGAGGTRPIANAIDVEGGRYHTCLIHTGRTRVSCAGVNSFGDLGRGMATPAPVPVADAAALPGGTTVRSLHLGDGFYSSHTCVIPMTGRPLCWGTNTYYQLGATGGSVVTPQALDPYYTMPQGVALGRDFTCVEYVNGAFGNRVACQGTNGYGQLGDGTSGASSDGVPDDVGASSDRSTFLSGVSLITAGRNFVCVKLDSGGVTCWGDNSAGQFGTPTPSIRTFCATTSLVPGLP